MRCEIKIIEVSRTYWSRVSDSFRPDYVVGVKTAVIGLINLLSILEMYRDGGHKLLAI